MTFERGLGVAFFVIAALILIIYAFRYQIYYLFNTGKEKWEQMWPIEWSKTGRKSRRNAFLE